MESPAVSVITVNPGQRISLISDVSADRVSFRCLPPGVEEPIVDPGIGAPGSVLKRVDERTVRAHIDTRGMSSGEGWWYLLGEDDEHPEKQVAELGRFIVRDAPRALVGLSLPPPALSSSSRFDMLGAVSAKSFSAVGTSPSKGVGVLGLSVAAIGGALVGALVGKLIA